MRWRRSQIAWAIVAVAVAVGGGYILRRHQGRLDSNMIVRFVIPDGFRGIVVVAEHKEGGDARSVDETPTYRIPENGVLEIRDASPLREWHSTEAVYASGAMLPAGIGTLVQPYDPEVKLYSVSADSNGRFYFLVGTEEELAAVVNSGARQPGSVLDRPRR